MASPAEVAELGKQNRGIPAGIGRSVATQRAIYAVPVCNTLWLVELSLQVHGVPEESVVKTVPASGLDKSIDEGMRECRIEIALVRWTVGRFHQNGTLLHVR